jgi:hypothetical protein
MVGYSRVGDCWRIGTIASRFVMLGYMHYDAKKEKFQPFFEKFSLTSKEVITIIRLERLLPCKCFLKWVCSGAVWLGCLRNNQSGSKSNSIKFGHLYVYVRYGFKRYHSSW